jgi:hypothetical protein
MTPRTCGSRPIAANGPHAPTRAARPDGTRTNRTAAGENEGGDQSWRSSPAGHTKIFWKSRLGADPRTRREPQNPQPRLLDAAPGSRHMTPPRPLPPSGPCTALAGEPDGDTADSDPDGKPYPAPWPHSVAGHARTATAGPPAGRPRCNTAPADTSAGTVARTPSTGSADAADDAALEYARISGHAGAGPREVPTPERSSRGAERLFRSATPFTRWPRLLHPALTRTGNHSNRHQPIATWLPWLRENGSLLGRHRQVAQLFGTLRADA